MSSGSSTESYPSFARIGLRENPGKNLNQVTCLDRDSNPGHLVSRPDALAITPLLHSCELKNYRIFLEFQGTYFIWYLLSKEEKCEEDVPPSLPRGTATDTFKIGWDEVLGVVRVSDADIKFKDLGLRTLRFLPVGHLKAVVYSTLKQHIRAACDAIRMQPGIFERVRQSLLRHNMAFSFRFFIVYRTLHDVTVSCYIIRYGYAVISLLHDITISHKMWHFPHFCTSNKHVKTQQLTHLSGDIAGLFKLQDLVKVPPAMRTEMYIRQATPGTYRQVLREIRQKEIYKLIVDTNPRHMYQFFRAELKFLRSLDPILKRMTHINIYTTPPLSRPI
ncbi:hypothetical protein ANN_03573 [Periplaneta americana]|uniref:Uncharacterized protein n=1 Tax=Periplaneta americana TaxID=6978 RepID=A0ABQ8U2Z7_PERAM|nr:hypothetical protein ANN_03573 [Periplaneta americana]